MITFSCHAKFISEPVIPKDRPIMYLNNSYSTNGVSTFVFLHEIYIILLINDDKRISLVSSSLEKWTKRK